MPEGYVISRVTLRVKVTLNENELAALLYDALTSALEDMRRIDVTMLSAAFVRSTVRARLASHGRDSVACGPQNGDGYDESMKKACVLAVRRAFLPKEAF